MKFDLTMIPYSAGNKNIIIKTVQFFIIYFLLKFCLDEEVTHLGLPYHCDECEYDTINAGNLKFHKGLVHKDKKYLCDDC